MEDDPLPQVTEFQSMSRIVIAVLLALTIAEPVWASGTNHPIECIGKRILKHYEKSRDVKLFGYINAEQNSINLYEIKTVAKWTDLKGTTPVKSRKEQRNILFKITGVNDVFYKLELDGEVNGGGQNYGERCKICKSA
jgi:hypothetical protein